MARSRQSEQWCTRTTVSFVLSPPPTGQFAHGRGHRAVNRVAGLLRVAELRRIVKDGAQKEGKWRMRAGRAQQVGMMEDPIEMVCSIVHASYEKVRLHSMPSSTDVDKSR